MKRRMPPGRVVWLLFVVAVVVVAVRGLPSIMDGLRFVHESPAMPLWKTAANSRPYSIGIGNALVYTLLRVLAGTGFGFALGSCLGLLLSRSWYAGPRFYHVLLLFAPVAPLVWLPFLMASFGIGEFTVLLLVASASFFICSVVVFYLACNTKQHYLSIAKSLGASDNQCLVHIVLPFLTPMLLLLFRISLFAGWMAVLSAEMSGVDQGLGAMLIMGRSLGNDAMIYLAAALIVVCAVFVDRMISRTAFRVLRRRYGEAIRIKG